MYCDFGEGIYPRPDESFTKQKKTKKNSRTRHRPDVIRHRQPDTNIQVN